MSDDDFDRPFLPPWTGVALIVAAVPTLLALFLGVVDTRAGAVTSYLSTVGPAGLWWMVGPRLITKVQLWLADRAERKEAADAAPVP